MIKRTINFRNRNSYETNKKRDKTKPFSTRIENDIITKSLQMIEISIGKRIRTNRFWYDLYAIEYTLRILFQVYITLFTYNPVTCSV